MSNVNGILKRAAEKTGFNRVKFIESNVPTNISNVTVFLFFGDITSTFVLSSILLKRYKEEAKGSKYFILCSWKGNEGLFPYVDEYWEIGDDRYLKQIYNKTDRFKNNSEAILSYHRLLNTFFEEVVDFSELQSFYDLGFEKTFFDRFKHIKKWLPSVPSSVILGSEFNRRLFENKKSVFIYPTTHVQDLRYGHIDFLPVSENFWHALVDKLILEGYSVVVNQDFYTLDLSQKYAEKCLYLQNINVLEKLAAMRGCSCVLDIFSGISRMAIAARTPYVLCVDRGVYNYLKWHEIDILCGGNIPKKFFYIYPSITDEINISHWKSSFFDGIISKLDSLIGVSLPSSSEINEVVKYQDAIKEKKKMLGLRFLKPSF